MCVVNIDKDVLKCALNNLTLNEVKLTLESNGINVDNKSKKHELIDLILNKLREGNLTEQLYLAIKTKAFSTSDTFYEGFFYKYNIDNIEIIGEKFVDVLDGLSKQECDSKQGNISFEYRFYNENINIENKTITFTFFRESKKGSYDYKDDEVKFFHNKIQADVKIYYGIGIVYIHSKNLTESTAIKYFLQKAINIFLVDKNASKIKLGSPKFDNKIVEKWSKNINFNVNGISATTIHMLDLLCEFDNEDNNFSGFGIKRIYLEHEVIDTKDDSKIAGLIFWGENLQKRDEILKEITNGKKIKGFDLEVQYQYEDIEKGNEVLTVLNISIVQENNNSIRIILSDDNISNKNVLSSAFDSIKLVFLNKIKIDIIKNSEALVDFINKCKDVKENKGEIKKGNRMVY